MHTRSIPKVSSLKKSSTLPEYKFTGLEDVDDKILDYIDFKTLITLSKDNKYIERLIKNNKKINDVIELLINNSTYDPHKDRYLLLNNDKIEDYVINLLVNDEVGQARKIIEFFETKNHPLDLRHLNLELYVSLLEKIIYDKNLFMDEKLYENLLPLKPKNLTYKDTLIEELRGILNIDTFDYSLPLIITISTAAKNIDDTILINELQNLLSYLTDQRIGLLYNDFEFEEDAEKFMDDIDELRYLNILSRLNPLIPIPKPNKK